MLRAIIIDDEPIGITALEILIEKYTPGIKVVATATDPKKGIQLIEDYEPNIVFLDISMPKMNAFELLESLTYKNFKLVFTTAHQEYAIKAIKNRAFDYLLKPIDIQELQACVANIISESPKEAPAATPSINIIELSVKDGIIFVHPQDIIRIEASGSYTVFYLANQVKHMVSKNLKEVESMLEAPYFFRCHASHIINLLKVTKMISTGGLYAQMNDGSMPEISRRNKDSFLEKLKQI
jgi:two-component system LytT family response regulator